MGSRLDAIARYVWVPAVLLLPGVLLLSSILTLRELGEMRAVYLRNRAANIAGRLENLPLADIDALYAGEPALADLEVYERGAASPANNALEALWSGRELFRTERAAIDGRPIFRAYVPFHSEGRMHVARIDLEASAADFLVRHSRHNLIIGGVAGLALVLLSLYAVWTARRAAALQHLAQLGKLSAVLAHEIRNPLGTIKGFAQLAGEKADSGVRALLDPVLEEVGRLERLVNDLLLYGRPVAPAVRETDWNAVAQELEMNARQLVDGRPVEVAVEPAACRFSTDPDLLRRALLNLVRNAVEAAAGSPGAAVRVAVAAHGAGAVVSVEDNGPGIPEAVRRRLFEPFHTTKASGTGLGLSITRKLAEALGGRLELHAAAPRGTRAELVFPHLRLEPADGNHTCG